MKLIFLSGPEKGKRYRVERDIILGRDVSNDIVIADPSVSLVHCQLKLAGPRAFLTDLGSTNGIAINGHRVITGEFFDGDEIRIGENAIHVEFPDGRAKPAGIPTVQMAPPVEKASAKKKEPGHRPTVVMPTGELSGNIFGSVTYYLKRKIANGGMGAIYEAEQFGAEGFIKKVAIKTILPSYAERESFVSSFIGEAKLVANLVHQNIVQIHHLGRHEGGYYIAMEYIDGVTLTEFMVRHSWLDRLIPVDLSLFIASRVSRGLEYAHGKKDEHGHSLGLVHRDVSPNNIMITREGEVKLTDFGVAKAAQFMEEEEGLLVGSVEYMSPEQADCQPVDGRSDIFSLGLVLFELLTGVRVFQCENGNLDETVQRVKAAKVPDPLEWRPELSKNIADILHKCLSKNPDDRYQTAGELGYALEHELYSKGYGPTIVALASYIGKMEQAVGKLRNNLSHEG